MSAPNGVVLWRGASLIDGAPIVVIATGLKSGSSNRKTGAMVQTYILREDVSPLDAIASGADASICGDCRHRGTVRDGKAGYGRTCYVNVGQGPLGVWKAYKRNRYPDIVAPGQRASYTGELAAVGAGRIVRLGTYGDPAAVPAEVWFALTSRATGRTGYTHQWRTTPALRTLCMASVDTEAEAAEARAAGWRYFRVAMPSSLARLEVEAICPASAEAGKKLTCAQCLACHGADGHSRGNIVIQAHGGFAVMAHVNRAGIRAYFARPQS